MFRFIRELEDEVMKGNHKNWSLFPNSEQGWTAKWVYPLEPYVKKWYHFGIKPKHKERYVFSSTLLVFTTDAEHFYQFVQTISLLAIVYFSQGSWYSLGAFALGLIVAQVVKEKIKNIN